jgi:adenylate kinase family enzyme
MRIAILGNSGSGKSTLALWLAEHTGTALLDLDTVVWEPNKVAVARTEHVALSDVRAFCTTHRNWIIEGCYAHLIAATFEFDAQLVFLNPGEAACIANCKSRSWEPHKYISKSEQDKHLSFLLDWVRGYYTRSDDMSLVRHAACFNSHEGAKREFKSSFDLSTPPRDLLAWLRKTEAHGEQHTQSLDALAH